MMNGSHQPVIEFHGAETTIAAENVGNAAIGVRIVQDDLTGDPNSTYSGVLGLKSTVTTITAEGSKALGIWRRAITRSMSEVTSR